MSATDDLLANNAAYAATFNHQDLSNRPRRRLAVVTCMDSRLDVFRVLGLEPGEAHVIRNAGGLATDDVIRSLALSQRVMGTEEILIIHHRDCGILAKSDSDFRRELFEDTSVRPTWTVDATDNVEENVRRSMAAILASPFLAHSASLRGFVYDEATGRLKEVRQASGPSKSSERSS